MGQRDCTDCKFNRDEWACLQGHGRLPGTAQTWTPIQDCHAWDDKNAQSESDKERICPKCSGKELYYRYQDKVDRLILKCKRCDYSWMEKINKSASTEPEKEKEICICHDVVKGYKISLEGLTEWFNLTCKKCGCTL